MNITVQSTKLGEISIEEDRIISMPEGIPGFRHITSYVLVNNHKEGSPFLWLQAVEDPELAFVVTDPVGFWPDYKPEIPAEDLLDLQLLDPEAMALLIIMTVPGEDPGTWTANLMAPLVINATTRQGKQVILYDAGYTHKEPLLQEPAAVG